MNASTPPPPTNQPERQVVVAELGFGLFVAQNVREEAVGRTALLEDLKGAVTSVFWQHNVGSFGLLAK